jgi:ribose 5-phosphate isomerase B
MKIKVALGADHGGFSLKNELATRLQEDYKVQDMGAHTLAPDDDYPDFVLTVSHEITSGQAKRGILICGSGVGTCIAANKIPGIRACLCHDTYSAHQGVEHDGMNVLCLGARIIGIELAEELARVFLRADFSTEARHHRRLKKVLDIEQQALQGGPK